MSAIDFTDLVPGVRLEREGVPGFDDDPFSIPAVRRSGVPRRPVGMG